MHLYAVTEQICVVMYTYTHIHRQKRIHADIHAYIRTYIHAYITVDALRDLSTL